MKKKNKYQKPAITSINKRTSVSGAGCPTSKTTGGWQSESCRC